MEKTQVEMTEEQRAFEQATRIFERIACRDTQNWFREQGSVQAAWDHCDKSVYMLLFLSIVRPLSEVKDLIIRLVGETPTFQCGACTANFRALMALDAEKIDHREVGYIVGCSGNISFSADKLRELIPTIVIDQACVDSLLARL